MVNLITYLLVWTNPSVFTIYLNRVIGVAMNTFSGTTCSFACLSDLYEDPEDFAFAASALLDPLGVGLIAGPLVGLAAMRVTNGNFTLVFVAAALGSLWQLLNCFRFPIGGLRCRGRRGHRFCWPLRHYAHGPFE